MVFFYYFICSIQKYNDVLSAFEKSIKYKNNFHFYKENFILKLFYLSFPFKHQKAFYNEVK